MESITYGHARSEQNADRVRPPNVPRSLTPIVWILVFSSNSEILSNQKGACFRARTNLATCASAQLIDSSHAGLKRRERRAGTAANTQRIVTMHAVPQAL